MQSDHPRQKGFYIRKLGLRDPEPKAKGIRKPARECARQARERKKAYITNLEVDLADAKKKLHIATQEIMQLKQLLSHKEVEDKQYQSGNEGFEGLMVEFQKLYENLQRGNTGEISRSLSFLRDKFGISGRERFKNIDALLDRMVSILMPMHYRLLMDNATKNKQFYELLGPRQAERGLVKFNEFEREVLLKVRPKINRQKKEYDQLLAQLSDIRLRIRKVNLDCQAIVDEIEDKLSPTYVASLLVDLDCTRSQSGLDQAYPLCFWLDLKAGVAHEPPEGQVDHRDEEVLNYQYDEQIFNSLFA